MGKHTFSTGQIVQFTRVARDIFRGNPHYDGKFAITAIDLVPQTCVDPQSVHYQGGMEGQDAVGHHQSLKLEGRVGWVSGALLEPFPASKEFTVIQREGISHTPFYDI